jgi:hypothetical protein
MTTMALIRSFYLHPLSLELLGKDCHGVNLNILLSM